MFKRLVAVGILSGWLALAAPAAAAPSAATLAQVETIFEQWRLDSHVPGLVYGVVIDGNLVAVKGLGVQDITANRPVTPDSRFRIASMSKAFTALSILKLRDAGKLSLDAPAELYVPQMRAWTYPTTDSRKIRVRDLLNHTAGFVTDDPWGDRHQPMSDEAFTAMLKAGVPFARSPGIAMEYSNFGYATLGRIITNVSGQRYQDYIRSHFMAPLGMTATGYDIAKSPLDQRAIGYRWQDNAWLREPDMADGAFGAMGGVETSANDYAHWVAFLQSGWPARDSTDTGPVKRATIREIVEGSNFPRGVVRAAEIGGAPCRQAQNYAMGWYIIDDCDLGRVLSHGGGYPGYGSRVLLLPDRNAGIFVFTNRTYSGPTPPAFKALLLLAARGDLPVRKTPESPRIAQAYAVAQAVWSSGSVANVKPTLAMNFFLDRDEAHWQTRLAQLKAEVGSCSTSIPPVSLSAMQANFDWTCEHGRITGNLLLAPTPETTLQRLDFDVTTP